MSNPPLDFQQNPVEFVKDALRVARAAIDAKSIHARDVNGADYLDKFDPPTVIAIMEDWLRLREAASALADKLDLIIAHPAYASVFTLAMIHGAPYSGPSFELELKVLRATLAKQG